MNNERNRIIFTWIGKQNSFIVSIGLFCIYLLIFFLLIEIYKYTLYEPYSLAQNEYIKNPNWDYSLHDTILKIIIGISNMASIYFTYLFFKYETEREYFLAPIVSVFLLFALFSVYFMYVNDFNYFESFT